MYIIKTNKFTICEPTKEQAEKVYSQIKTRHEYIKYLIKEGYHISKAFAIANGKDTIANSLKIKQVTK